jgi:DNA-binding CsgD family transcriptional regulator
MGQWSRTGGDVPTGAGGQGVRVSPILVGRDDLLALAERRLGAVRAGSGHLLFLSGEAGVGKTRLLREIAHRAAATGFTIVRAAAFPRDTEIAGGVLVDLARELRFSGDAGVVAAGRGIAERLGSGAEVVGDAHRRRRLLTAELTDLIAAACAGPDPVLLAVEDLHWADDLTLEVLDRLARDLERLPMLVVGTYRSDELYPRVPMRHWRARLLTQRLAEEARLPRLSPDDTAAMAAAITETTLPTTLSTMVHERSDGIPLHIEELLATLAGPASRHPGDDVPDTLADAVLARAEALTAPATALARAACAIGRSFDLDLLTAITAASPAVVDAGLRELCERFFVQPRGDGSNYDFRHALISDALYADLPPHQRRDLHARVAAASTAAGFGDAFLSDQYERAHQPALAYRHALAAAADATRLSAHREAVELYRRAQRTAPSETPDKERAALLSTLAAELAATDDNAAAAATYQQAYELNRHLGDDLAAAQLVPALVAARHLLGADLDERTGRLREALSLIEPAPGATPAGQRTRIRLLAAVSAAYMLDRRLDEAVEHGEQARTLAAQIGDETALLNTDVTVGSVYLFTGRMSEGWQLLQNATGRARDGRVEAEAARGYRMIGSAASVLVEYDLALRWLPEGVAYAEHTERWNDRHYMAAHLAHVYWATGDAQAADREARGALADGRGGITTRIAALHVLGYLAMGRGDWTAAVGHLDEARELGGQMNELQRVSPAIWGLAETALRSGRTDEVIAWCEEGYAASATVGDAAYLFPFVITGTRAYLQRGEPTSARRWVEQSAQILCRRNIPGTLPALDHARGLLHLTDGHTGKAREALTKAAAAWDARHRIWEGIQALLDLATCAVRSRRPAEAAALAAQARDRAESAAATALLAAAPIVLSGAHARHSSAPLTAREVEVARLIATGATNRQIAATLFIAPKTVAAHVEHILTKLCATRRTEIAAWAASRQPAPPGR